MFPQTDPSRIHLWTQSYYHLHHTQVEQHTGDQKPSRPWATSHVLKLHGRIPRLYKDHRRQGSEERRKGRCPGSHVWSRDEIKEWEREIKERWAREETVAWFLLVAPFLECQMTGWHFRQESEMENRSSCRSNRVAKMRQGKRCRNPHRNTKHQQNIINQMFSSAFVKWKIPIRSNPYGLLSNVMQC